MARYELILRLDGALRLAIITSKRSLAVDREFMYIGLAGPGQAEGRTEGGRAEGRAEGAF